MAALALLVIRQDTHHLTSGGLGNLHLLQHLVPLFHDESSLVRVGRYVRVMHLDDVNICLNPSREKRHTIEAATS